MANDKPIATLTSEQQALFWSKVRKTDGCWVWTGQLTPSGYGIVGATRRTMRVHRVAYALIRGAIPAGLVLDHRCHNRACVNPDHLEPVTSEENVRRVAPPSQRHRIESGRCVQCQKPSETYRCVPCRKIHNDHDRPSVRKRLNRQRASKRCSENRSND